MSVSKSGRRWTLKFGGKKEGESGEQGYKDVRVASICLWCVSSQECVEYPVRRILPPSDLCELRSARWGVCWVNFEALIIAMSVVGGMILIMLGVCCCCCCRKKSKKPDKDDEKAAREREKRRVRQEERRAEMKSRHDEIRRKYGLFKEENPYAKFEN
ncbi:PREDICTED: pituitary tumor-transforming gene 1 protein-interacting protein [Tinamus guttatus]|uniref:pituitary tumor-transforming gene 1 protein-interacting protein n=1 Tax=Tinamus guttatus TaxID=94827 RepID=UPI00052F3096|nr:PREDICTED: pituitary tumor-transforming gene 1 protein-interacting protein [Tinamus guttatus]